MLSSEVVDLMMMRGCGPPFDSQRCPANRRASSSPPHGSCFDLPRYGLRERLRRWYGSNSRLPRIQIFAQRYGQQAIKRNAQLGCVPTPALC